MMTSQTKKIPIIVRQSLQIGMKGFFRLRTLNQSTGKVRIDTGWFPNKILNSGKNSMATQSSWLTACQVGTDSTPPTAAQKSLLGYYAGTTTINENITGSNGIAPYYGYRRITYRFAAGTTATNLSEVGVGWNSAQGDFLISRALIIDPVTQEATTVTPLADEVLDVTYEFRYYAPENDVLGPQVTLNGETYDTITRAADVTGLRWHSSIGSAIGEWSQYTSDWAAFDGELGAVDQSPSGLSAYADNVNHYNLTYQNNSYERVIGCNIGPTGWNLANGIRCLRIMTTAGAFQTRFGKVGGGDETIPKDSSYTMVMQWLISWAAINVIGTWTKIAAHDSNPVPSGQWNTNGTNTLLRISWDDDSNTYQQLNLRADTGTLFRIVDATDATKWVEYTVNGAYTEQASWTEIPVTQTAINNGGPSTNNLCRIRNLN